MELKRSSGGPLLNFINFKLIGIYKDYKGSKDFNLGTFIKPLLEDFFNSKDFNNFNFNDDFENEINNNKSIYYLIFIISFLKELLKSYAIYPLSQFEIESKMLFTKMYTIIIIDMIIGIILKIIELFFISNNKILLILSLALYFIPFCPMKILISSFYQIIPFFNNEMIQGIIIFEALGNIYGGILFSFDDFRKKLVMPTTIFSVSLIIQYENIFGCFSF